MKYLLSLLLAAGVISCTAATEETTKQTKIGTPNPASKYCVDNGGKIIMKKDSEGNTFGICKLKNGEEVDEWEYFRENSKN